MGLFYFSKFPQRRSSIFLIFTLFIFLNSYSEEISKSVFYLYGTVAWLSVLLGCLGLTLISYSFKNNGLLKNFEVLSSPYLLLTGFVLYLPYLKELKNKPILISFCFLVWIFLSALIRRSFWMRNNFEGHKFIFKRGFLAFSCLGIFLLTLNLAFDQWFSSAEMSWFTCDKYFISVFNVLKIWGFLSMLCVSYAFAIIIAIYDVEFTTPPLLKQTHHILLFFIIGWGVCWVVYNYMVLIQGRLGSVNRIGNLFSNLNWINFVVCFLIPFLLLLTSSAKKDPLSLKIIAFWIFLSHFSDMLWQVVPMFSNIDLQLRDIVFVFTISIFWWNLFKKEYKSRSLIYGCNLILKELSNHG